MAPPDSGRTDALLGLVRELAAELHRTPLERRVHLDADLDRDLGMDSLARVELLSRAERRFGARLPEHAFADARTPRDLLGALARFAPAPAPSRPAARPAPPPAERIAARPAPASTRTLVEALEWHVEHHGDRTHIRLYGDDDGEARPVAYRDLLEGARRAGAGLQALGVGKGDPVVLMLQTGRDYFDAFFGTLLAGAIPVPIYPPARPAQIEDHVRRQRGIIENCGASILVTMTEAVPVARLLRAQIEGLRHVITPIDLGRTGSELVRPRIGTDDLAFLQYTSGSTGQPKGVMLTHANLLANIRAMARQIRAGSDDVFVSWLPLYHDMGLIGAWLGSLYCATELVIMSPLAFIARPQRWLRAIHHHRATLSASPNFGYELCLRRLDDDDLEGLDLGSWRCAFNGAEPVSPDTLHRFSERFAPFGLRRGALMPVYGLAECSVGLAFPPLDRGPLVDRVQRDPFLRTGRALPASTDDDNALAFVSSGSALPGHEIRIVDESQREVPGREVGRLQFRGPSATRGYFRNPEATRSLIRGEWLDSGDLAYEARGEVYITGRSRDVIIYAGRNLYPHEIEDAVGRVAGVRPGRVAAFGSRDPRLGTERFVVVAETHEREEAAREALRAEIGAVVSTLSAGPPDDIVLASPGAILKTPSGKVRRAAIRERYARGDVRRPPPPVWRQIINLTLQDAPRRLRRSLRRFAAAAHGVWAYTAFALIAPVGWLLVAIAPGPRARWRVLRTLLALLARLARIRLHVRGREHLPARGRPRVYVCNHASYLDGALLALALPDPVAFVAKAELRRNILVRIFLERLGTEFVERHDARRGAQDARALADRVRAGKPLLFFPEGTFTRAPGLRPFRMGAFTAAVDSGVDLVPLALSGSRSLLRSESWRPNPGEATLTIAAPIDPARVAPADSDTWTRALALRAHARDAILAGSGEHDLEDTNGGLEGTEGRSER